MQSLPKMNGALRVSTFSFTVIFSGEKQANIWIIFQRDKNGRVS